MNALSFLRSLIYCLIASVLKMRLAGGEDYYVVGSNYGQSPDPNAIALSSYLSRSGFHVVYIADRNCELGLTFFKRGGLKSTLIFLNAKAIFYTHSLSDVLPNGHKLSFLKEWLEFPNAVFIQHGIIGLKNTLSNGKSMASYVKSLEKTFDHMIVSSESEASIVQDMGVPFQKIAVTGLPRFDNYKIESKSQRVFLVFFTWQSESKLLAKYQEVRVAMSAEQLERSGYQYVEAIHQMQSGKLDGSLGKADSTTFNNALRDCAVLVTDDSSVAWDVLYQGGEVLFYKPTSGWFLTDAWMNDRICGSPSELVQKFLAIQAGEYESPKHFTKFRDTENSRRVAELVLTREQG